MNKFGLFCALPLVFSTNAFGKTKKHKVSHQEASLLQMVNYDHYVSGDLGIALPQKLSNVDYDNYKPKNSFFYGLAIGTDYNKHFSYDLSFYRMNKFKFSKITSDGPSSGSSLATQNIVSTVGMVNGYGKYQNDTKFVPYFTLGFGGAYNQASNYNKPDHGIYYKGASKLNFGYNVGAGVEYQVLPRVTLAVSYRFFDLGKISTSSVVSTQFGEDVQEPIKSNLKAHTISLGIKYGF